MGHFWEFRLKNAHFPPWASRPAPDLQIIFHILLFLQL